MSGLSGIKKNIKLKNQNLVLYEESVSGDMIGSKRSVRVHIIGEEAFILRIQGRGMKTVPLPNTKLTGKSLRI